MYVYMYVSVHTVHIWRSEDNLISDLIVYLV